MKTKQYTLRQVPPRVDRSLRQKARESGKSLNRVILDALTRATDSSELDSADDDLDSLVGSWEDAPGVEEALKAFDRVDSQLWQ